MYEVAGDWAARNFAGPSEFAGQTASEGGRVPEKLRQHLTYANVTATLALFISLGGSSYAALRVGSQQIADNSIRSRDVHNHSLTRHDLARSTLDSSVI